MTKPMATVIPIRRTGARRIDLALALAMLSKAVKAHERARLAKLTLLARSSVRPLDRWSHAKSLGA